MLFAVGWRSSRDFFFFFNTDPEKKADHVKFWYESVNSMPLENIAETVLLHNV